MPVQVRSDERETPSRRAQRQQHKVLARRRRRWSIAAAVVVLLGALAVIIVVRSSADRGDSDEAKADALLFLDEYSISGALAVAAGDVRFVVTNNGSLAHNVGVRGGPITANLPPGQAGQLQIDDLAAGTYELYCDIADHEERGMTTTLLVVGAATPSSVTTTG